MHTASMRLTTKGRYAVTAMLDIALHQEAGAISVVDIAARQDISSSYLEQIFSRLKAAELLHSRRGPGGGYEIARSLAQISVSDIVIAVGDGVDATRCHGAADCQDGVQCLTHDLWSDLSGEIDSYLRSVSLQALVDRKQIRFIAERQDPALIEARHI
ncbi:MAG: Rrf2 family transcriptional regulator [Pseudomonadales bacterium]